MSRVLTNACTRRSGSGAGARLPGSTITGSAYRNDSYQNSVCYCRGPCAAPQLTPPAATARHRSAPRWPSSVRSWRGSSCSPTRRRTPPSGSGRALPRRSCSEVPLTSAMRRGIDRTLAEFVPPPSRAGTRRARGSSPVPGCAPVGASAAGRAASMPVHPYAYATSRSLRDWTTVYARRDRVAIDLMLYPRAGSRAGADRLRDRSRARRRKAWAGRLDLPGGDLDREEASGRS